MLEDRLMNDYKEAMKAKDTLKSSVLSFLRAQLKNAAIDKRKDSLDDSECLAVIKKQIKERQESIEQFTKGLRQDLADKEAKELEILKSYLPPQLTSDEVKKIIEEVVLSVGAQGPKDMGRVMKELTARVAGHSDGKLLSDLVKERLAKAA